jgi:hypothetical protein
MFQPVKDMANPYEKEHKRCILCQYDLDVHYKVSLVSLIQPVVTYSLVYIPHFALHFTGEKIG